MNTNTWKFKDKEVLISEMDEKSVLKATLHSLKRIHYYHRQHKFNSEKLKQEGLSTSKIKRAEYMVKKSEDIKRLFIEKLELLEERGKILGLDIPTDDYEGVKEMLSELKEVHA